MLLAILMATVVASPSASCDAARADGDARGAYKYAKCLTTRTSPPPDYATGRRYFQRALSGGYQPAACSIADLMIAGLGGAADPAGGTALCRRAADSGDAESEAQFGSHALRGAGMTRDAILGRTMLTAAARQGHALAALTVGMIYWNGDGVAKDKAVARGWWQQAYRSGRKEAAVLLGDEAFVRLTSVPTPDKADPAVLEEAVDWYNRTLAEDPDASSQAAARNRLAMLVPMRGIVGKPLPPH